jgi:uncharacterized protein involved in exopolysaccharide biosynthesis
MNNKPFNLIELIKIVLKWRIPIIVLIAVAALGGVVTSFVMDEYYKSKSVFFPTNLSITDRQMLFSEATGDMLPSYFGDERDIERVLTIAKSEPLVDFMINRFELYDVYNIDTTNEQWKFYAKRQFNSNFTAKKTKLGAISIEILDTDPKRAAQMVNTIVRVIDQRNLETVQNMKSGIVSSFEKKYREKQKEVNKLTDSLSDLKAKYNIEKVAGGSEEDANYEASSPTALTQFEVLKSRHENALEELTRFSTLYEQYEVSAEQDVSSVYILEKAYPANKKAKPVRWLICVATTLIATVLAVIGAIMAEKFKDLRQALRDAQ